jgi:hypothetical protein
MFDEFSSFVSYNTGVFLPLCPTMQEFFPLYPIQQKNLFHCIPPHRRFCSIVGYSGEKGYNAE